MIHHILTKKNLIGKKISDYTPTVMLWAFPLTSWFGETDISSQAQSITMEGKGPVYKHAIPGVYRPLPH